MIDSHCHLDSREFEGRVDETLSAARNAGLSVIVNIGVDLTSSRASVDLAERFDEVYATVGVHPHDAKNYSPGTEQALDKLLNHQKVVALGEIGLDFYRDLSPRPAQRRVFHAQLELAARRSCPVVIHVRDSFAEAFEIVSDHLSGLPAVVFHCFSEGVAEARRVIDAGCYISVGGITTYKNSVMADVAAFAPLDRLLLETDSPYLTPVPNRGKLNQPANVRYVCEKVAELKKLRVHEVERKTDLTCRKFYRMVETFE
ncbi:MAG: TatD family hydrolase [Candidatus Zixiibacteriota bacterium]